MGIGKRTIMVSREFLGQVAVETSSGIVEMLANAVLGLVSCDSRFMRRRQCSDVLPGNAADASSQGSQHTRLRSLRKAGTDGMEGD